MQRRVLLKSTAAALLAMRGSGGSSLVAPAIAQPANTATLRFVPQANLTLLDPVFTTATVTSNHGYYVFDTLYSVGPDGGSYPQMAEGHSVSDDKLTWRIRLREGLFFHDGSPVRATDCIANSALVRARPIRPAARRCCGPLFGGRRPHAGDQAQSAVPAAGHGARQG